MSYGSEANPEGPDEPAQILGDGQEGATPARCAQEVLQIMHDIHEELHRQGGQQAVAITVLTEQAKAQQAILGRMEIVLQRMVLYLIMALVVCAFGLRGLELLTHR